MIGIVATSSSASNVGGFAANGCVARGDRVELTRRRDRHVDAFGADAGLQLGRRAVRDRAAVVEHDDVVGELIGLFEVLRREDDRGAVLHEVAQHVPEIVAAARVETGGRLVEEQHARVRRRGSRRGRAGGACRPRTSSRAAATRRRGRGARAARRRGGRRRCFERWCRRPTITRFLRALISPSTVACWAATPMRSRTASGLRHHVEAGDRRRALGGLRERGEDADRRGLAGAVVAEQPEDRARGHVEVEIPERPEVAEALAQAAGRDARRCRGSG